MEESVTHLKSEQNKQHYLHLQQHPHSHRDKVSAFQYFDGQKHRDRIAIVNHNALQIYETIGNTVTFIENKQFMCDITIAEVVPLKGDHSDWIFIADQLGRYCFWSPDQGQIQVSNTIRRVDFSGQYFQKSETQEKSTQFSGINYHFQILDTDARIFYTVDQKIIFLDFTVRKGRIIYKQPPITVQIPYRQIIYAGMMSSRDGLIGIVAIKQQKSFLYIHRIDSITKNFRCIYYLEKTNLRSFFSHHNQLVLITTNQLSIYHQKQNPNTGTFHILNNNASICNFQISQWGHVVHLHEQKYLFVSEVCQQMVVFSTKSYKNYGAFVLDNDVCISIAVHSVLSDGGYLISVIDKGYAIQFIAIYQENWKSIKSIQGMSPLFSLDDIQGSSSSSLLAVTRISDSFHQVGILSKIKPCNLNKQTQTNNQIINIFTLNNGHAILLCTSEQNTVFIYDDLTVAFELGFELFSGDVIFAIDKYLVSSNKIYEVDLSTNRITQIHEENDIIVSADFSGKYIGYQTEKLKFKFFNIQTKQIDLIRSNSQMEYIWKFHAPELMLVASFDRPGEISLVPVFQPTISKIKLETQEAISDICSYGQLIAVAYVTPKIQIYSIQTKKLVYNLKKSSHSFKLTGYPFSFLAYSSSETYLISIDPIKNTIKSKSIEFDMQKDCVQCIYLNSCQKILVGHENSVSLYQKLPLNQSPEISNFRIIGVSMSNKEQEEEPPFVISHQSNIYIVSPYEITVRNTQTAELIKKQRHSLKQIQCIQKLSSRGILIGGVNDMQDGQIILIGFDNLSIQYSESLGKKIPNAIKSTNKPNQFFVRCQDFVSLYQFTSTQKLKLKFSSKTNLYGYTLGINPQNSMVVISDPLRYTVIYDYRKGQLIAIARYRNNNTLNDVDFIGNSVVCSDNIGNIRILQFNLNSDELNRTLMTQVGSLKTSTDISYLGKGKNNTLIYSGSSGSVGRIILLTYQQFTILKQAEMHILEKLSASQNKFKYNQWRRKRNIKDKIIDDFLIKKYMQSQLQNSNDISNIWHKITGEFI